LRNLAEWLLEILRERFELRLRGHTLSEPELDALSDSYGFAFPASLRALLRIAASYTLPTIHQLTPRIRPEREILSIDPTPFGTLQWFPLSLRFGGFYPIGTNEKQEVFAVSLLSEDAVYRWAPSGEMVCVAPSLETFWADLLADRLQDRPEKSEAAKIVESFSWIEAFLGGRYTSAARLYIERRPTPLEACVIHPGCALYWLFDSFILGDTKRQEVLQASAHIPLVKRLSSLLDASGKLSLQYNLTEGRAQLRYELSRIDTSLPKEKQQELLLESITANAPIARVLGVLSLSTPETAKRISYLAESFSKGGEIAYSHQWMALSTLALAHAQEHYGTVEQADVLAWNWRQDPWYGTRPGEAERLSLLVSAYSIVDRYDRAEALLSYVQEKAPGAGAALAARVDLLLQSGREQESVAALEQALQQLPADHHLHASRARLEAKGLAVSWVDPAWPQVIRALAEEALRGDAATRISALERLRQLLVNRADPPAMPFLLIIVQNDPAGRAGALRALAHCPFAEAIPVLVEWAKREDDPLHATLALEALQKNTSDEARAALAELGQELPARLSNPKKEEPALDIFAIDKQLRDGSREVAAKIVQQAASLAAWAKSPTERDDLQSLRALAMAKSGMLRDAVELADVLAWGWRQDPLCGERPGEPERLARLIDAYRVANRADRAKPLIAFLRQKSSSDAPLAVEIDLALDQNNEEQAQTLLWEGLSRYPGSRWLHSCRLRLGKRATEISWVDPSWPASIRDALLKVLSPELGERVSALEKLATELTLRRQTHSDPLELPFVLSLAYHDEPPAAHAAFIVICAHPFLSAKPLLRTKVQSPDDDIAAMAVRALSQLGETAAEDLAVFVSERLYVRVPSLLVVLSEITYKSELLRQELLSAISQEGLNGTWLGPWLLRALAPFATPQDLDFVEPFLRDPYPTSLRVAALFVVAQTIARRDEPTENHEQTNGSNPTLAVWVEPFLFANEPELQAAAKEILGLDAIPGHEQVS
jgi:tetratricopeptide (TPR) repeat protein